MLRGNEAPERRAESHNLIEDLIRLRAEMLTLYSRLAACRPYEDESVLELLEEFCETLVDYTASAHFRVYRFLDENRERRRAVLDTANRVYPRIAQSTQTIVDFNDRYENAVREGCPPDLEDDLSRLGEELAERIELEDELIEALRAPRHEAAAKSLSE